MNVDYKLKEKFKFFESIDKDTQNDSYKSLYFNKFINNPQKINNKIENNLENNTDKLLNLTITSSINNKCNNLAANDTIKEIKNSDEEDKSMLMLASTAVTRSPNNIQEIPSKLYVTISNTLSNNINFKETNIYEIKKRDVKFDCNKKEQKRLDENIFTFKPKINENSKKYAESKRSKSNINKKEPEAEKKDEIKKEQKRQVDINKINFIYQKGINSLKNKTNVYNKNKEIEDNSYKNFSYKPHIHNYSISPDRSVEGSFLERQNIYKTRSESQKALIVRDEQTKKNKNCTFKPNIENTFIPNDEHVILKNIDKINEFVNNRRQNINKAKIEKEYYDNLYTGKTFKIQPRKIINENLISKNKLPFSKNSNNYSGLNTSSTNCTINNNNNYITKSRQDYQTNSFFDDELSDFSTLSKINMNSKFKVKDSEIKEAILNLNKILND